MAGEFAQLGQRLAIVLGGAISLHDDIRKAREFCDDPLIIAVNDAGFDYEWKVDHWVSMHPFLLERLVKQREKRGFQPAGKLWAPRHISTPEGMEFGRVSSWGGSSGLLAVTLAFDLKVEKVILCGIPMSPEGAHYFSPKRPWNDAVQYKAAWSRNFDRMNGHVKSFSGWTAQLLGMPTKDWADA